MMKTTSLKGAFELIDLGSVTVSISHEKERVILLIDITLSVLTFEYKKSRLKSSILTWLDSLCISNWITPFTPHWFIFHICFLPHRITSKLVFLLHFVAHIVHTDLPQHCTSSAVVPLDHTVICSHCFFELYNNVHTDLP